MIGRDNVTAGKSLFRLNQKFTARNLWKGAHISLDIREKWEGNGESGPGGAHRKSWIG